MSGTNTRTPNWLSQMEHVLEELNEGVGIADDQLRLIFANDALLQLAQYNLEEVRGCTPMRCSRQKIFLLSSDSTNVTCASAVIAMSFIFRAKMAKRSPRFLAANDYGARRPKTAPFFGSGHSSVH